MNIIAASSKTYTVAEKPGKENIRVAELTSIFDKPCIFVELSVFTIR